MWHRIQGGGSWPNVCRSNKCYAFSWTERTQTQCCTLKRAPVSDTISFPQSQLCTPRSHWRPTAVLICQPAPFQLLCSSVISPLPPRFYFESQVLDPALRRLCISNSVRFLCSQTRSHSCSPSINKKDVGTAGNHTLIYLCAEMRRMEWSDGHYLNLVWLQTSWSPGRGKWTRKPSLKVSLSTRL